MQKSERIPDFDHFLKEATMFLPPPFIGMFTLNLIKVVIRIGTSNYFRNSTLLGLVLLLFFSSYLSLTE